LLQRNTSDLSEQRFSSVFTGEEFFLADHQVQANGQASRRVLPGVAYLRWRAAIEQALPARPKPAILELHNTVWAQPVVVVGKKEVSIAVLAAPEPAALALSVDDEQFDFEIYSEDAGRETTHCQAAPY
jgi:polyketide synthase PksN